MQRIRVCLFLDGETAPLWVAELLRSIQADGHADTVLVVTRRATTDDADRLQAERPATGFGAAVRRQLERAQRVLFERYQDVRDAFVPTALATVLADAARLELAPRAATPADLARLAATPFDVGLCLGSWMPPPEVRRLAGFGVWSLHHADDRVHRGGPPGFWETMLGWRETGAVLTCLVCPDEGAVERREVLARTRISTMEWSPRDNANAIHWAALRLIPRQLAQLRTLGGAAFTARVAAANRVPSIHSGPVLARPGNRAYAGLLLRKTVQKVQRMWRNRRWRDQWILLYSFSRTLDLALGGYTRLQPPPDRMWADPQVIERDGRHYVFFEEMLFANPRGHIAVIELSRDGTMSAPRRVLERPYHLSYPFLFEHQGTLYMIPESGENRSIELYRCAEFPHRWEFVHKLMDDVAAYDTTLLQRDGRWWLFVTIVETEGTSSWNELFIFFADDPLSQTWTPHAANPVVSDCRSARPAGPLFEHEGALYRPSQNSSGRYGRGFNLCRIDLLDTGSYAETIVAEALPDWADDVVATHTFGRAGELHLIDAQVRCRRLPRG